MMLELILKGKHMYSLNFIVKYLLNKTLTLRECKRGMHSLYFSFFSLYLFLACFIDFSFSPDK